MDRLKSFSVRNVVRFIILTPITLFLLYCSYFFIANTVKISYDDCGEVKAELKAIEV